MTLADYIAKNYAGNVTAFARSSGIERSVVSTHMRGKRRPRPALLQKYVAVTGGEVTANDFFSAVCDADR